MTHILAVDAGTHVFWLGSRTLGIVAMVLTSLSVGLGLAMSTRIGRKPGFMARFKVVHEALALVSLVAIAGHGLLLLGDPFLHPTIAQISVPFLLGRDPFWTGLGVIAGWLALAFTVSFYFRRRIGVKRWRQPAPMDDPRVRSRYRSHTRDGHRRGIDLVAGDARRCRRADLDPGSSAGRSAKPAGDQVTIGGVDLSSDVHALARAFWAAVANGTAPTPRGVTITGHEAWLTT